MSVLMVTFWMFFMMTSLAYVLTEQGHNKSIDFFIKCLLVLSFVGFLACAAYMVITGQLS